MIIRMSRHFANDHPDWQAFCKWSSRLAGLLHVIIRMSWPFTNDHLDFFLSSRYFQFIIFLQQTSSSPWKHFFFKSWGSRFNLADLSKNNLFLLFHFSNKVYSKPPDIAVPWFQKKRKCHHLECEATVATHINPNQIKAEKTGEGDGVSVCWWNKRTLLSVSPLLTTFPCCHLGLNPQTWWKEGNA